MEVRAISTKFQLAVLAVVASCTSVFAFDAVYVSGKGSNSSNCTAASPCSTIAAALTVVPQAGEIICLDAPVPSNLLITKAVTIDCSAGPAVVEAFNTAPPPYNDYGTLVFINIPTDLNFRDVKLIGLLLTGSGSNQQNPTYASSLGIQIQSAGTVHLERINTVNLFRGVLDRRSASGSLLYVKDSEFRHTSGPAITAIAAATSGTFLDNVRLHKNGYGVAAGSGNNVVITRSTISGSTTAGVSADGGANINVSDSVFSHNNWAVNAVGTVRLENSSIQFNSRAIQASAARSLGGNRFAGNSTVGSIPTLATGAPADVYD